jgi:hypothetical protein
MNHFLTVVAFGFAYYEAYILMPSHFTVGWITRETKTGPYNAFFCDGTRRAVCHPLSQKGARAWLLEQVALSAVTKTEAAIAPAAPVEAGAK